MTGRRRSQDIGPRLLRDRTDCPCGKVGWPTRALAKAVVKDMRHKHGEPAGRKLDAYRCVKTGSGLWHTGHTWLDPNLNDGRVRWIDLPGV